MVVGYKLQTGTKKEGVEILFGNGERTSTHFGDLVVLLDQFKEIRQETAIVVHRTDRLVTANNLSTIKDTVLAMIDNVTKDPSKIPQAKQVFQGVNTLMNIAKTEIAYSKFKEDKE